MSWHESTVRVNKVISVVEVGTGKERKKTREIAKEKLKERISGDGVFRGEWVRWWDQGKMAMGM